MENIIQNQNAEVACELILRSLPDWFGIEESLVEYAESTQNLPTFVYERSGEIIGFITLRKHFLESWEIHCIAVRLNHRNSGVGRSLLEFTKDWLKAQGAVFLQVKTLAASHFSLEYAQTRLFYQRAGFFPSRCFQHCGVRTILLS